MRLLLSSFIIIFFFFAASVTSALPLEDEVANLPGYGAPPSRFFSGYVPDGNGGMLWYLWSFPDSSSFPGQDPSTSTAIPVISTTTGGPCCSSALFFTTEAGPLLFDTYNATLPRKNSSAAPLHLNPYSFTKKGHVFAISQPAGVGFSYGTKSKSALDTDDNLAAERLFYATKYLLINKFPGFVANPYFSIGESYAGIFMLLQADLIMDWRANVTKAGESPSSISSGSSSYSTVEQALYSNWRGLLVGNGVTDHQFDDSLLHSAGQYGQNHALLSQSQFNAIAKDCPADHHGADSDNCNLNWNLFPFDTAGGMDIYDTTSWCYNPKTILEDRRHPLLADRHFLGNIKWRAGVQDKAQAVALEKELDDMVEKNLDGPTGPRYQCPIYQDLTCTAEVNERSYLQRADVMAALHIPAGLHFSFCATCNYNKTVDSVVPIYTRLMGFNQAGGGNVTVLIYNGDADLAVPYTGTWGWMQAAGWNALSEYRRWTYFDNERPLWGAQLGGYGVQLDGGLPGTDKGLWFATVHGAGHMVPSTKPAAAFDMLGRIMSGTRPFNKSTALGKPTPFLANPISDSAAFSQQASAPSLSTGGAMGVGILIGAVVIGVVVIGVVFFANRKGRGGGGGAGSVGDVALESSSSTNGATTGYMSHEA